MGFLDFLRKKPGPAPGQVPMQAQKVGGARAPRKARRSEPPPDFSRPVTVEYINFRGEHRTFTAAASSIRRRGAHLSMRVTPSGKRIALKRDKILNLAIVELELGRS